MSAERIRRCAFELREFIGRLTDLQLEADRRWLETIARVESQIDQKPEVEVALLGGTGSGKSTLVNAVSGVRLLPVNSMRVTTAAITEVSYQAEGYTADVEFVDRTAWLDELEMIAEDVFDQRREGDDGEVDLSVPQAARDKLTLVYGEQATDNFFGTLDMGHLVEPAEIADVFSRGRQRIETSDAAALRAHIKNYLDSQSRFWPIVKRVRVRGPFPSLADGAVLVDLPGLNDPNADREKATREHLTQAQFVWVVFNMKRALTRDVFDFLREGDLLRRLYVDGRTGSMALVGTASDEIDADHDIEEFGLDDEASDFAIVTARNNAVESTVRGQLRELSTLLAQESREEISVAKELIRQVESAPIFCVSARDYQKCRGIMAKRAPFVIQDEVGTGIPLLQGHLAETVAAFGERAHSERLFAELDDVRRDALRLIRSRLGAIRAEREASKEQLEGVRAQALQAHSFLCSEVDRGADRFHHAMAEAREILSHRLMSATREAQTDIQSLRAVWGTMHWNTLKATARRGGRWVARDRSLDISKQVADPLVRNVSFQWVDFFGIKADANLEVFEAHLENAVSSYLKSFEVAFASVPGLKSVFDDYGRGVSEETQKLVVSQLGELRRQVSERLQDDRKQLHEQVVDRIAAEMKPAFLAAAQESGPGMRDRMVDIIYRKASEAAGTMYADVREQLEQLLTELLAFIGKRVRKLRSDVERETAALVRVVETRVTADVGNLSPGQFEAALVALEASAPDIGIAS